jgi:MFS family permease
MAFLIPLAPQRKRVGYITGMMAVMAPIGMAASASAGYIMEIFGHRILFLGGAILLLIGLIPLALCRPEEDRIIEDDIEEHVSVPHEREGSGAFQAQKAT